MRAVRTLERAVCPPAVGVACLRMTRNVSAFAPRCATLGRRTSASRWVLTSYNRRVAAGRISLAVWARRSSTRLTRCGSWVCLTNTRALEMGRGDVTLREELRGERVRDHDPYRGWSRGGVRPKRGRDVPREVHGSAGASEAGVWDKDGSAVQHRGSSNRRRKIRDGPAGPP